MKDVTKGLRHNKLLNLEEVILLANEAWTSEPTWKVGMNERLHR